MKPLTLAVIIILFSAASAFSQEPYSGGPITNWAVKIGKTSCIEEIKAMDRFLNEKAGPNGAITNAAKEEVDSRIYSSMNIKKFNDNTWGYATLSVSPGRDGSCDGLLTTIVTFPSKTCGLMRDTDFKDYKYSGELAGKAIYSYENVSMVLEEIGGGCVVIKYEPLYPVPVGAKK